MQEKIKKLNLGCGEFKKEGYVNVDWGPQTKADILHDLNKFPYPFSDNEFGLIEADHVLEHLSDSFQVMNELHRISRNCGRIIIRVPHFSRGFTHPEHQRGFDVTFPYYFNRSVKQYYQGTDLELDNMRFSWMAQPYLKKSILPAAVYYIAAGFGFIVDAFANVFPLLCSRIWCYWVGGFEEISFEFIVRK